MSCCALSVFLDDFNYYFLKELGCIPTVNQLRNAKSDWRAGSTGWEGVQIAKERIADAARKAAEKPLVNIGGNNYAHEGSDLAAKYSKQS
jgi:hypothetical protein